jgi:hypothetical protein
LLIERDLYHSQNAVDSAIRKRESSGRDYSCDADLSGLMTAFSFSLAISITA